MNSNKIWGDICVLSYTLSACASSKQEHPLSLESYTVVRSDTTNTQVNAYHPNVRGGIGRIFDDKGRDLEYISGVANVPLGEDSSFTVIGHAIDRLNSGLNDASTLQVAYDLNTNWSLGGGVLQFSEKDNDINFGRILYTHKTNELELLVGGLVKEIANDMQPGLSGLVGLTNVCGFQPVIGMQREKEQARYTAGIIFPKLSSQNQEEATQTNNTPIIQPALDILYVDNQVGDKPGPQFTLGNVTLGYNGKFFPTKGKAGRLLGGTGIWAPNPIFGTDPSVTHNFNRILDPAALGNFFNLQYVGFRKPNGDNAVHLDALAFPAQFDATHSSLDRLFIGLSHDSFGDKSRTGPLFGATFDLLGLTGNFVISVYPDEVHCSLSASVRF